jgi:hypothetical protein
VCEKSVEDACSTYREGMKQVNRERIESPAAAAYIYVSLAYRIPFGQILTVIVPTFSRMPAF